MSSDREEIPNDDVKTSDGSDINKSLLNHSSNTTRFNRLLEHNLALRTKTTPSPSVAKKRQIIDLTIDDQPETITHKRARHEQLEDTDNVIPKPFGKVRQGVLGNTRNKSSKPIRKARPEVLGDTDNALSKSFRKARHGVVKNTGNNSSRAFLRNTSCEVLENTEDDLSRASSPNVDEAFEDSEDELSSLIRKPTRIRKEAQDDLLKTLRNVRHGNTEGGLVGGSHKESGKTHPHPPNPPDDGVRVVIPVKGSDESRGALRSILDTPNSTSDSAAAGNQHGQGEITLTADESKVRQRFLRHLAALGNPKVTLVNDIDGSTPTVTFKFVKQSTLGQGVSKLSDEFMMGCECRAENGRHCGCEYLYCTCLPEPVTKGARKAFPYSMGKQDKACLRQIFLNNRQHIYECNARCNCNDNCKNRVVQFGCKVKLQIFKTANRGWGLRCLSDLQKGQFVDTYRGEIITAEESDRRGKTRNPDEGNYLMDFDKFQEPDSLTKEAFLDLHPKKIRWHAQEVEKGEWTIDHDADGNERWLNPDFVPCKYVCDGMHVGGPTRFINHSCAPNLQVHTASTNHADQEIYDLAFFAKEDIPAGTELTFDYKDEDDRDVITEEMANEVGRLKSYRPAKCLCGAVGCRGYFFT